MNRTIAPVLCVVVLLGTVYASAGIIGTPGGSYTIEARGRLSQFQAYVTDSFTGTEPVVPILPEVSIGLSSGDGVINVEGQANPFAARAAIVNHGSGIAKPDVWAKFLDSAIQIESGPALDALIPSGQSTLDLLINFTASVQRATDGYSSLAPLVSVGTATQTTLNVSAEVHAISQAGDEKRTGGFNVFNGSFGAHTFTTSGFFDGLPEADGGTVTVSVPATISTSAADGLIVGIRGQAAVQDLALSAGFVNAEAVAKLANPDPAEAVTLTDGTPLTSLGVGVTFLPVPEPATLALLAVGSLVLLRRRRRRVTYHACCTIQER